jgi:tRNA nucleotidyltransferase (CCA-adding enzyme)
MQIYMVGGAVRDRLLGLPVQDRDWVVVGATPEDMVARGFVPVGRDFPVFLHPDTHEEYALARTERKSGRGYRGFVVHTSPDVTLEDDLARRDLTINSIAACADSTGAGGLFDSKRPDRPLRRPARPAGTRAAPRDGGLCRGPGAHPARGALCGALPRLFRRARDPGPDAPDGGAGEADHLVPERVWQELARGLMESHPARMFEVLRQCGALAVVLPELERLWGVPQRPATTPRSTPACT